MTNDKHRSGEPFRSSEEKPPAHLHGMYSSPRKCSRCGFATISRKAYWEHHKICSESA